MDKLRQIGIIWIGFACTLLAEDAPKPPESGALVIVDSSGKEQKIKDFKFSAGMRPLTWLTPESKEEQGKSSKKNQGPEALVVRAETKIHFVAGVLTLIPLERLRLIEFDEGKALMTVRVATGPRKEDEVVLTGTTAYKGINKVTLEAEVDKGEAGIAELTYQGGILKGGIQAIHFPEPKVEAFKPGRPAVVQTRDSEVQTTHQVYDLAPLYTLRSGREKTSSLLMFRKTLKLDLSKLKSIVASTEEERDLVWQVVQKDGEASTLTLLTSVPFEGQTATLTGLLGRVPEGYKIFPLKRVQRIDFDVTEPPKSKSKGKKIDLE